ncbi:MAG: hypothetical protein FWC28_07570 [Proteobacteria bacterium]|nr:hypothetical protein [Cystobacterineae bacterium]MCL2258398.1 hypothetical protein [Cystobacterineae bacterium]MCL2315090.1 hypothetical protein [Pseudomonadota bacterium]
MRKRYSIHKDGDLLVETFDASGNPLEVEPVPPEERLPIEVNIQCPEGEVWLEQLLDLLETAYGLEEEGLQNLRSPLQTPPPRLNNR